MKNFDIPLIDCDVHPIATPQRPLEPFISEKFRPAIEQGLASAPGHGYRNPFGVMRRDMPAMEPECWGAELLDRYGVAYAILQPPGLGVSLTHNIDIGCVMATAWNEWQIANWLESDSRFLGSICVNMNDPQKAAAEIRRVGTHSQMVQVVVCGESTHLYGHRSYDPVYEACAELGLPFAMHPGNEGSRNSSTPNGMPSSYLEWHATLPMTFMAHCASFVCEGTFEKFPGLKVVLVEGGFGWLPHLMWRLDKDFKSLRSTTPWLKRLPSEYIVEHVRITTQPIEEPETPMQLLQLFDMMHAEKTLCFASDFPHWDFDDPRRVFPSRMDSTLKERIFYRNAGELYGLPPLEEKQAEWAAMEVAVA